MKLGTALRRVGLPVTLAVLNLALVVVWLGVLAPLIEDLEVRKQATQNANSSLRGQIDRRVLDREVQRVTIHDPDERRVQPVIGPGCKLDVAGGDLPHLRDGVDGDHASRLAREVGQLQRFEAAADADVENALSGLHVLQVDRRPAPIVHLVHDRRDVETGQEPWRLRHAAEAWLRRFGSFAVDVLDGGVVAHAGRCPFRRRRVLACPTRANRQS